MKTAVLLAVSGLVLLAAAEERSAFSLAVLRRDGLVVPFAAFDGRRWQTPWPDGTTTRDLPLTLPDVPTRWWGLDQRPAKLALWRDGARSGDVTLTGLTTARLMCQPRVALRSDYKVAPPLPPPFARPYPKDGLLVAGEARIGAIVPVEKGSEPWNHALVLVTPEFNAAETAAAAAFSHWRHPVAADDRRLVPITVEALYAGAVDSAGWSAYFVEAVRRYPPARNDRNDRNDRADRDRRDNDDCGPLTYASGWILTGPQGRARVRLSSRVTYCDRYGVRYMLPFGTVSAGGRTYWIFQFSGYESEWYEVMRPTPDRVESHAAYDAGSCSAE